MNKLNKKSINLSLKTLTILAFAFLFVPFNGVSADTIPVYTESGVNSFYQVTNNAAYQAPVYIAPAPVYFAPAPAPTPVIHSSSTNPNPVMTVNYTPKKTVAVAKTKPKTVATVASPNTGNALAANAVYGSNGFLPSGIIQWILLLIAILIVTILARTVFGAKDNYHSTPLKHE
jgi:hypothetical protein